MATVTATDFLVATGTPGLWVRLHNNVSGTDYYSTAVSDPQGAFTYTVPTGEYSLYVGSAATVPGTPTLRNGHFQVAVRNGDDAALNSGTFQSTGPYGAFLPGAPTAPTPAGVSTGQLWDWGGEGVHIRNFNPHADGVTDDKATIVTAQAKAIALGLPLVWGSGSFAVSDYVDVNPGTRWLGAVGIGFTTGFGTYIVATGANKGVVRMRPGSIGSQAPVAGQADIYFENINFAGGGTTGHLVNLARIVKARFLQCTFENSAGTGFKDDGSTSIAAAGLYVFGCEILSAINCTFSGQTSVSGNGGAGIMGEKSMHDFAFWNCHFNNNTNHARINDIDCGVMTFTCCHFNVGNNALFSDAGAWYNLNFCECWFEGQAVNVINSSGLSNPNTLSLMNCNVYKGAGAATTAISIGAVDAAVFTGNRYNGWSVVYSMAPGLYGGSIDQGNLETGVTNLFGSNDPAANGFVMARGVAIGLITLAYSASITPNGRQGNLFTITATNNTAFTIVNPTTPTKGQQYTFLIRNASGGAMGVITWMAAAKMNAFVNPANGFSRSITFYYDGNNFVEFWRSAADVTN